MEFESNYLMEPTESIRIGEGSPVADQAQACSKIPEPSLDDLVEENFETLDPGCPQTKKSRRINPKKLCTHCEWTQTGTQQVFVNHILDLSSNVRTKVCQNVPEHIKAQFEKAVSNPELPRVLTSPAIIERVIPIISDEVLSQMVDFSADFWTRDRFIRQFELINRKSSLSAMTFQNMFTDFKTNCHERWTQLKSSKVNVEPTIVLLSPPAKVPRSIAEVLKFAESPKLNRPGRQPVAVPAKERKFPAKGSDTHLSWLATLPWLRYDGRSIFCTLCVSRLASRRMAEPNSFTVGTEYFQHDNLKLHAAKHHAQDMKNLVLERPIVIRFKHQALLEKSRIIAIVERVYLIAKKNYPLSGLEDLAGLGDGLGTSYVTRTACTEFVQIIASVVRDELCTLCQESPCFGLIIDESTAIDKSAALIMYLRPIINGAAETKYMALIELMGKNAEAIMNAIMEVCQDYRIDLKNLSNIASDGASVVAGKHTGVCKRLGDIFNPYITVNHCIAHRTALAGDNATEKCALAKKMDKSMREVVNFYSHSSSRTNTLAKVQEELGLAKLRMVRMIVTRWLCRSGVGIYTIFPVKLPVFPVKLPVFPVLFRFFP